MIGKICEKESVPDDNNNNVCLDGQEPRISFLLSFSLHSPVYECVFHAPRKWHLHSGLVPLRDSHFYFKFFPLISFFWLILVVDVCKY